MGFFDSTGVGFPFRVNLFGEDIAAVGIASHGDFQAGLWPTF